MAQPGQEIFNPVTGQRMVFRETSASSGGEVLRVESTHPTSPRAEPVHIHPFQQSSFEVLDGQLRVSIDGEERVLQAGESLIIPAGAPHTFWNASGDTARSMQEFRPALNTEEFFEEYFALAASGELKPDGSPTLLRIAVMLPRFSGVMRPASPPWPILRAICAVLAPIARWRGYDPAPTATRVAAASPG